MFQLPMTTTTTTAAARSSAATTIKTKNIASHSVHSKLKPIIYIFLLSLSLSAILFYALLLYVSFDSPSQQHTRKYNVPAFAAPMPVCCICHAHSISFLPLFSQSTLCRLSSAHFCPIQNENWSGLLCLHKFRTKDEEEEESEWWFRVVRHTRTHTNIHIHCKSPPNET